MPTRQPIGARASLGPGLPDYVPLDALADRVDLAHAPVTFRILLENVLRHAGRGIVTTPDVGRLISWRPGAGGDAEIPFLPARVILQDFTGVPTVVDLAAMRDAMAALGGAVYWSNEAKTAEADTAGLPPWKLLCEARPQCQSCRNTGVPAM